MADTTHRRTLAGAALSGCGADKSADSGAGSGADASGAQGGPSDSAAAAAPQGGGRALARTSEIPVGGGKVFKDQKVVVTQPAAGQFKAFSATCTHQGCSVASVTDQNIVCPCHQSLFKISDGSVAGGPATRPLPPAKITVEGDRISLG